MKYKHANEIEPGNEIIVQGKPTTVEHTSEVPGLITITHSNGRLHRRPYDKILLALSKEETTEAAQQIIWRTSK